MNRARFVVTISRAWTRRVHSQQRLARYITRDYRTVLAPSDFHCSPKTPRAPSASAQRRRIASQIAPSTTEQETTTPLVETEDTVEMAEQAQDSSAAAATQQPAEKKAEPALPKLSAADYKIYNRMADHMNYFHDNFRHSWNLLYNAAVDRKRPAGMSIRSYLSTGLSFCHHLTIHHTIEEQSIFPVLAARMPVFSKELELLTQHKQIHKGLDVFEKYLEDCRDGERELRFQEVREIMDGFGTVLWKHLDDEVEQLKAENMRKYWSKAEMARLPM